jgi:hypothetical protein
MVVVTDPEADVRRLIDEVLACSRQVVEHVKALPPDATMRSNPTWVDLTRRSIAVQNQLGQWLESTISSLDDGEASPGGPALAYLEADPYYFRSGYARWRLAVRLSRVTLPGPQRSRARDLVLTVIDGQRHCGQPGLGRLAASVTDNELRRAVRQRLHSADGVVARRALRTIQHIRHPGLDRREVDAARSLVVLDAGAGLFLAPGLERLSRWLWTPEWQSDLQRVIRVHGPNRSGAKRLLEAAARRKLKRPGP